MEQFYLRIEKDLDFDFWSNFNCKIDPLECIPAIFRSRDPEYRRYVPELSVAAAWSVHPRLTARIATQRAASLVGVSRRRDGKRRGHFGLSLSCENRSYTVRDSNKSDSGDRTRGPLAPGLNHDPQVTKIGAAVPSIPRKSHFIVVD